ncbi:helix-turn-helix domain-containing protein [Thomasclavelia cocleata]|uniref:helix-turn-helix domain-containing protein n=1 Tax=Thomasclavelia cocleata TaxID=69824 RepID=UPI00272EE780|nr:helix-turn-helix domain-containing protein [Thomasclavelia cocleata]
MSNLNLKGIWIPIEILTDNKLSDKEKIIYAIVIYLSKENQYCFLTNKTISELLNISVTQVSNLINSLKSKEYIDTELIYKENTKQVEMRKLIPIKNEDTYLRKVKYPLQANFNTPIKEKFKNNKYNSDKKFQKKSMANFEQRKYDDIDFTRLYANADAFI